MLPQAKKKAKLTKLMLKRINSHYCLKKIKNKIDF